MAIFQGTVGGERITLIVPCTEIFRFYYRHSTRLASRILRGTLASAPHWIYDASSSWVDTDGSARIELSVTKDVIDAYTAAHFLLDPIDFKRATTIVTKAALAQRGTLPLDVLPPFNGRWRLRARGKWLAYGYSRPFLVFALVRCNAAVPFKELSVYGGTTYGNWHAPGERQEHSSEPTPCRRVIAPAGVTVVLPGDPDVRGRRVRLPTLDTDRRYPEVLIHQVTQRRKRRKTASGTHGKFTDVPTAAKRVAVSDTRMAEGSDSGTFALTGGHVREPREGRDHPDLLQRTLDILPMIAFACGFDCRLRQRVIDFSEVYEGPPPAWASLGKGTNAFRSLHLASVQPNGLYALVVDVQRKPGTSEQIRTLIACSTSFEELGDHRVTVLLRRIPIYQGHLHDLDGVRQPQDVRLSGTNHLDSDTSERFRAHILSKLVGLIDEIDVSALK